MGFEPLCTRPVVGGFSVAAAAAAEEAAVAVGEATEVLEPGGVGGVAVMIGVTAASTATGGTTVESDTPYYDYVSNDFLFFSFCFSSISPLSPFSFCTFQRIPVVESALAFFSFFSFLSLLLDVDASGESIGV